jgi:hypothetical protein
VPRCGLLFRACTKAMPYTAVSADSFPSTITSKLLHTVLMLSHIRVPSSLRIAHSFECNTCIEFSQSASLSRQRATHKGLHCAPLHGRSFRFENRNTIVVSAHGSQSLELTFDLLSILAKASLLPANIIGLLFLGPSQTRRVFVSGVERDRIFLSFKKNCVLRDIVYDPVFILLLHTGMVYLDIRLRLLYLFYFENISCKS